MRHILPLCAALLSGPVSAGVDEALTEVILPGYARFSEASEALATMARADCTAPALQDGWHAAFDAWTAVGDIRMGPSETGALSVVFWPDARGFTPKTLNRLFAAEQEVGTDPEAFAEVSIAVRGLFALEQMLFDTDFSGYAQGSYACTLVQTMTADLAAQALDLDAGWQGFAQVLQSAGEPGNAQFLSQDEALRALYTQVLTGLEFTADVRLGRPLGSFERPRPRRAEAYRSGRPLRNVLLDAEASLALAHRLVEWDLPRSSAAMERLRELAGRVSDPAFQDLDDPSARLRVEIVQQQVRALHDAVELEIGVPMGLTPGFNSQDGD